MHFLLSVNVFKKGIIADNNLVIKLN